MIVQNLNENWKMKEEGAKEYLYAKVPGSVIRYIWSMVL